MPAQKHIATWKLILAVCSAIFLAYTVQSYGTALIDSAHALDIQITPAHPNMCSDHTGGLLSGVWRTVCYFWFVVNFFLRIPIALIASVLMLPLYLGTLIAKLPALIIYEVFMTIATIVIFICLWLVESSLSPAPGTIAHTFLYQDQMQNIIYSSLWVPVRDIANVGFALVLLFGAITTILYANKEWLSTHAQKLFLMIILVNFSWFFSRVMLDIGNVAAKTAFSLAPIQDCVPSPQNDCQEIKNIVPNPWLTFAFDAVFAEPFVGPPNPANYTCPLLLICVRKGPPGPAPVDRITAGIMEGYVRILYVEGTDALGRIRNFFGWANIQRFYTRIFTTSENVLTLVLRLAMDLITDVLVMNARVMTLMIVAILFLTAIVILFVIFLMRIPIIWLTQGFMPICTLIPFLPGKLQSMVKENLWDKFLVAVFLPALVGLPLAAGFAILRAAQNLGVGAAFDVAAQMPPAAQILFGNFVNSASQLFFVILAIAILWFGVITAMKSYVLIPQLQDAAVEKISGIGKYGARAWGEFAAKRMPIAPSPGTVESANQWLGKALGLEKLGQTTIGRKLGLGTLTSTTGIPQGIGGLKRYLAGKAPGAGPKLGPEGTEGTPKPGPRPGPSGKGPTPPPDSGPMLIGPDGKPITSPPPVPKKALLPEKRKELVGRTIDVDGARATVDKVSDDGKTVSLTGADGTKYETPYENLAGARVIKEKEEKETEKAGAPGTGKTPEPAEGTPPGATGKGVGEEVRKGAKEGVIEGMGGKVAEEKGMPMPAAVAAGAEALAPAAEGVAGEGAGGKAAEPTWGQTWEGVKNIMSNTRGGLAKHLPTFVWAGGKVGGAAKDIFTEAFRDKSQDGGLTLGHVITGAQSAGKELGTMARAGNAPLTKSASEALEEARSVRTVPPKHIDDAQAELKGNALLNQQLGTHIDTFLKQSGANSADALLQIKNTLNTILSSKGHGAPVNDINLPSYLENLLEKKKSAGEQGFGFGTTKDPRTLFSQVLAKVNEATVYRSKNPKPTNG